MMKLLKIVLITLGIYAGLVVIFESLLGYFQPQSQTTLIIITDDGEGRENNRVLQQLSSEGNIYVAANHWPRAWYHDVLDRPNVKATINDETANYLVTKVSKTEHKTLATEFAPSIWFRILTGFPPREFVKLTPE